MLKSSSPKQLQCSQTAAQSNMTVFYIEVPFSLVLRCFWQFAYHVSNSLWTGLWSSGELPSLSSLFFPQTKSLFTGYVPTSSPGRFSLVLEVGRKSALGTRLATCAIVGNLILLWLAQALLNERFTILKPLPGGKVIWGAELFSAPCSNHRFEYLHAWNRLENLLLLFNSKLV